MTLDEAIKHCEEKAKELSDKAYSEYGKSMTEEEAYDCNECAREHEQLAKWLKELKTLREVHGKVYRNEKCNRAGKCYDYIGYHCAGCNEAKKGGAE